MSYFKARESLLLQEYFDLKVKLVEFKIRQRFRDAEDDIHDEIKEIEKRIILIIGTFNKKQLEQIIFMSLDINYYQLVLDGVIIPSSLERC